MYQFSAYLALLAIVLPDSLAVRIPLTHKDGSVQHQGSVEQDAPGTSPSTALPQSQPADVPGHAPEAAGAAQAAQPEAVASRCGLHEWCTGLASELTVPFT